MDNFITRRVAGDGGGERGREGVPIARSRALALPPPPPRATLPAAVPAMPLVVGALARADETTLLNGVLTGAS